MHSETFSVDSVEELEAKLNAAIESAATAAQGRSRQGVLVTRHSYSCFTISLSEEVPFGQIREDDRTDQHGKPSAEASEQA
ncbi:hypothetical protein GC088_09815 [Arthrobacter sp. JZ12]|uniref:hypothetical protein n=1 Tax=Arthrobacter sp. JZ12 TaxID=2654190 RepID=UPI002B47386C|nr:hypothetical protein [Arthrobacter sp. JZ12]WRH25329.1 hypothetical protein GC088_09815 [Arthrobacter sp. JZ12]